MSSSDFLSRYTEARTGPATGLPVVSLRFSDADDLACPFVTDAGCRVYPARPASCRTYPLARGVSRDRDTGRLTEHWALIRESHCLGFKDGQRQAVDDWVDDQQLATHNRMNDKMLALISRKNRFRPGPLMPAEKKRIFTALYDLDAFRNDPFTEVAP
jgi:Fe-S-cluster containining protein